MPRRPDLIALGIVLVSSAAYQWVFLADGVGLIDEGHLANGALRISRGEVLYRDVYSVYPPASFYAVAGLLDVFGPSLIVVRTFHAALCVALALTVFALARLMMSTPWALLAALLVGASGWEAILERCHYAYLYSVFPMAALGLLGLTRAHDLAHDVAQARASGESGVGKFRDRVERRLLFGIGLLAGVTLTFRLVPFVGLAAATLVFLGLQERDLRRLAGRLAWVVAGGLCIVVPVAAAFASVSALEPLGLAVFWTSVDQYAGGGQFNLPFPAFAFLPEAWTQNGVARAFRVWEFYLPIALYAATFAEAILRRLRLGSRRGPEVRAIDSAAHLRLAVAIFGAVLYVRALGRSDYYHLAPVLAPAYLLGADALARVHARWCARPAVGAPLRWARSQAAGYVMVAALMTLSLCLHAAPAAIGRAQSNAGRVALAPGGPWVPEQSLVPRLVGALRARTEPGEPIVVLPWYPVLYFLADRPNPTRYDWLFPGYLRNDAERAAMLQTIEASGVEWVLYSPAAIDGLPERRLAAFEPELDGALRRLFRPVGRIGGFLLMRRGEE